MKRKMILKPYVLPSLYLLLIVLLALVATSTFKTEEKPKEEDINYVSNSILDPSIPVVSTPDTVIIRPFISDLVTAEKTFYDYKAENTNQERSIIYYEDTYMPSSGITYTSTEKFDVVTILDGTVIKVTDSELLGKTVEIRHDSNLISVYHSLSEVIVSEGDFISIGQTIAKSGTAKIYKNEGNKLHFELYSSGTIVNPENFFDKALKDL